MPPRRKTTPPADKPGADNQATPPADNPDEAKAPNPLAEYAEPAEAPAVGSPAWRRADDLRALREELEMCKSAGKTERVKAIEAAIKERKSRPTNRRAPGADEA